MKKEENTPHKFDSLSDLHRVLGLPKPLHPMISLVDDTDNKIGLHKLPHSFILNFYKISFSTNLSGKLKYGQHFHQTSGRRNKSSKFLPNDKYGLNGIR